ncbi:Camk/camkl protein kinase, partial [Globisporangium splendens]
MMNECRRKLQTVKVDHYDGQSIYSGNELIYELGGYLGGGAAGVRTQYTDLVIVVVCLIRNVWWLIHPTTKQAIAAFEDPRTGMVRELTLPQCIEIWGTEHAATENAMDTFQEVEVKNQIMKIPTIPKKFLKFAFTRRSIHREISNMSGLDFHENVLRLDAALELVQDSKCTTFLVLELAAGGELFDRIKLDCGTDEATARRYFRQLISGVAFCHTSGVCHRDLKPENLLLADTDENSTLKIADFGLSAIFAFTDSENAEGAAAQCIRRLRSVVGSPHYVAPEVLMDAGQGYDGAKADAWSIGVILYAMIAGNLPFGKDLLKCTRYDKFRKWSYNTKYSDDDPADEVVFPSWFFPQHFSLEVKSLIAQLLYPDPCMRLSVEEAQRHPWVLDQVIKKSSPSSINEEPQLSSPKAMPCHAPSYKTRSNVIVNIPQSTIDQEQRWGNAAAARSGMASPLGGFGRPIGLSICPPSPQKTPRPMHLVSGGYMPCVDEETSSTAGQTPPTSPRAQETMASPAAVDNAGSIRSHKDETSLQFEEEEGEIQDQTLESFDDLDAAVEVDEEREAPFGSTTTSASTLPRSTSRDASRQFISPPIAIESRGNTMFNRRHQHRRNSPPELFLSRFGKAARFEEIRMLSLDTLDLNTPTSLLSSTPTGESALASPASGTAVKSLAFVDAPPPCNDHVARSTRFLTALPAQLVLSKIEVILTSNPSPLPYPYKNVPQRVTIDWSNYQLEVRYGSILTCTVQVFLYQRGVYLVEFRRGQVEIFQFKRFYEDIREKISDSMETSEDASPSFIRKRNRSISGNAIF